MLMVALPLCQFLIKSGHFVLSIVLLIATFMASKSRFSIYGIEIFSDRQPRAVGWTTQAEAAIAFPEGRKSFNLVRDRGYVTGQFGCWVHDTHMERVQQAVAQAHYATIVAMGDATTPFSHAIPVAKKEGRNHVQPADVVRHIHRQIGKPVGVFYDNNYKAERLFTLHMTDEEMVIVEAAGGIEVFETAHGLADLNFDKVRTRCVGTSKGACCPLRRLNYSSRLWRKPSTPA